ncbi:hypothetical protein K7565_08520 [Stenotrophomonas maltophilia]|nr:hypothetical protein K7565_08520 [Stenotrophomonas maltophilia]
MTDERSFTAKTSAADTSIGFDYQHYYFLYRILNLGKGQSVGLEVKDDVHTELAADFNVLYQLKHTIQTNSSGGPIALTELDGDLWKTMHNWSKVISDAADGRKEVDEQLSFVAKTEFHLVSNKSVSKTNDFIKKLVECQRTSDFDDVDAHLGRLLQKTKDEKIAEYISSVLALNVRVRSRFFANVRFELDADDIIGMVKRAIHEKIIAENKVDQVFERLDSQVRSDNFIAVKNGGFSVISFDEFITRYRKIFEDARSGKLVQHNFEPVVPSDVFNQVFVARLIEVGALSASDKERAIEYTGQKIRLSTNLERWVQVGDLVGEEVARFHDAVYASWDNEFYGAFEKCTSIEDVVDRGMDILRRLKRERFSINESVLDVKLSNGELYYLSDIGKIGWHRDWAQVSE